ncbi:MAG: hypothetical protein LBD47_13635 [Treponema sp.]|jgi:hypothetical protein|nr:hypothetical protein [Treponema sp.]
MKKLEGDGMNVRKKSWILPCLLVISSIMTISCLNPVGFTPEGIKLSITAENYNYDANNAILWTVNGIKSAGITKVLVTRTNDSEYNKTYQDTSGGVLIPGQKRLASFHRPAPTPDSIKNDTPEIYHYAISVTVGAHIYDGVSYEEETLTFVPKDMPKPLENYYIFLVRKADKTLSLVDEVPPEANFDEDTEIVNPPINTSTTFPLIVKNRLDEEIKFAPFSVGTDIYTINDIAPHSQDIIYLPAGTHVTRLNSPSYGPFNTIIVGRPVEAADYITYLHIFKNNAGQITHEANGDPTFNYSLVVNTTQDRDSYGTLAVHNYLEKGIYKIWFFKEGNNTDYFYLNDISGRGAFTYSSKTFENENGHWVVMGNYKVVVQAEEGGPISEPIDWFIKPYNSLNGGANYLEIKDLNLTPQTIGYTVSANGGAGDPRDAAYTTTQITFTFDSDPGFTPTFVKDNGAAVIGLLTRTGPGTFTADCTTSVEPQEYLQLHCTDSDIDGTVKGVTVYRQDSTPPQVSTAYRYFYVDSGVKNPLPLQRHQSHTLTWEFTYRKVKYENGVSVIEELFTESNFGTFVIDSSNDTQGSDSDSDYVRFRQGGSYGNRDASLRVGTHPGNGNVVMAEDKAPGTGGYVWNFYTALDFTKDVQELQKSLGGVTIEDMPSAELPVYFGSWLFTKIKKENYLQLTFTIRN